MITRTDDVISIPAVCKTVLQWGNLSPIIDRVSWIMATQWRITKAKPKATANCHFALSIAISRIGQMKTSAQLWPLGCWSSYGHSPLVDQLHRQLHLPHQQTNALQSRCRCEDQDPGNYLLIYNPASQRNGEKPFTWSPLQSPAIVKDANPPRIEHIIQLHSTPSDLGFVGSGNRTNGGSLWEKNSLGIQRTWRICIWICIITRDN